MLSCRVSSAVSARRPVTARLCQLRTISLSGRDWQYDRTRKNLKIGSHTRVIFQGFTGRQATANAVESLAWGTKIVGGVTPGREGMHPVLTELPVFPTVKAAMSELKPDATGIYVAAHQAAAAIEEAIEAEIPLIVAVAEHIPLHDMLRVHAMLRTQTRSRLVGANAPGIISAIGRCRIGFQPLPCFAPGHVGIVAKSGTLSYEAVAALTRAGLGQSLCIGMGGDIVAGTDFVDALSVFEDDPDTHGIVVIGEIGGRAEEEAAGWIQDYRARTTNPKPIAALVAGKMAKPGHVMGHAGAWRGLSEHSAEVKHNLLRDAGAIMVDHPAQFGAVMREALARAPSRVGQAGAQAASQRRGYHTSRHPLQRTSIPSQRRSYHLPPASALDLLAKHGILTTPTPRVPKKNLVAITINRSSREPCLLVQRPYSDSVSIPLGRHDPPSIGAMSTALQYLGVAGTLPVIATTRLILALYTIFTTYEGITVGVHLALSHAANRASPIEISKPEFTFDDAAFRSGGRHAALHALRDVSPAAVDPIALAGEADGIVYVRLGPADPADPDYAAHNIGTLVNGAGLAMNTVDALALRGARAANFLDTGGKATAETVKKSFALLLEDERVKVIFVNIFGGLTLGDMIARGVLLAFQELGLEKRGMPVVVRIRGTNEAEGQRIIADSGLKVFAFDGFDEAAAKCVELAGR
ncbi:succinyl-CoA synthetase subunit alpha [Mycena belliarum]|uniref:Succinyl-CoA synthetase subunit alpha n=1 Tax=Mycena belliarum TaxID=1033014 RepID=A0AAD6XWG4_9AGAR|nr:succinyl-CoA synthetase subunit alpha [Mycena belliae]